jgi:hypothetical protein
MDYGRQLAGLEGAGLAADGVVGDVLNVDNSFPFSEIRDPYLLEYVGNIFRGTFPVVK